MRINEGTIYIIDEKFFKLLHKNGVTDVMSYARGCPAYCCYKDKNTFLLWMIPVSKDIEKQRAVYEKEMRRYGHCYSVVLGTCGTQEIAFKISDMFPVTKKYIKRPLIKDGRKLPVGHALRKEIRLNFDKLTNLSNKGITCLLNDTACIKQILLDA